MLTLDPVKLLIVAVVALLVLGPDKLPAAARKTSSLLSDLRRLRGSLHQQIQDQVRDHPLATELTGARDDLVRLRAAADPRQFLERSTGPRHDHPSRDPAAGHDPLQN
jgi:Sec-independent protein translocase protein TatA